MKLKTVSILIVLALIFVAAQPLISNAADCDKAKCPACFTVSGKPLSVTITITQGFLARSRLTLNGVYLIVNAAFNPSLIASQIDRPPRA